jgi:hypothetical protein
MAIHDMKVEREALDARARAILDECPLKTAQQAVVEVEELLFRGHPEVVDAEPIYCVEFAFSADERISDCRLKIL